MQLYNINIVLGIFLTIQLKTVKIINIQLLVYRFNSHADGRDMIQENVVIFVKFLSSSSLIQGKTFFLLYIFNSLSKSLCRYVVFISSCLSVDHFIFLNPVEFTYLLILSLCSCFVIYKFLSDLHCYLG